MIVSNEKYLDDPFVLSRGDVQRIADVFTRSIGRPTFEIQCRDGTSRSFNDVSGLLSFENGWSKRIRALWIRSADDEKMRRARLRFSAEHAPVYLEVAAESTAATALEGAIAGAVQMMRPGYVARHPVDLALALLAGGAGAVSAFFAMLAISSLWQASGPADLGATVWLVLGEIGALAVSLGSGFLACRPPGPLFPRTAFVWGRGIWRARMLQVLRGGIFLGAVCSLIFVIILNIGVR